MIYSISIRNEFNEDKQFYISANNISDMYKRILTQFGITKDKIELLEEYEETSDWGIKLVKSHIDHLSKEDKTNIKKAKELFFNSTRKCEPYKSKAIKKYGNVVYIKDEKDVIPLVEKYKEISIHWEPTETRGVRNYYALVR